MEDFAPYSFSRERRLILGTLFLLAGVGWAVIILQSQMMNRESMGLTAGMGAALYLASWVVMMIATMFPSVGPMVLAFATIKARSREHFQVFIPTWIFTSAYLVVWGTAGLLAYFAATLVDSHADKSRWLTDNGMQIGGLIFVLAGLYQLSPLKTRCLRICRMPLAFVLVSWRNGRLGAFLMGLEHASICLGCCWMLFLLMFPLGVMNIAAMVLITLVVFAEKASFVGEKVSIATAALLIIYGFIVVIEPNTLPHMH